MSNFYENLLFSEGPFLLRSMSCKFHHKPRAPDPFSLCQLEGVKKGERRVSGALE